MGNGMKVYFMIMFPAMQIAGTLDNIVIFSVH